MIFKEVQNTYGSTLNVSLETPDSFIVFLVRERPLESSISLDTGFVKSLESFLSSSTQIGTSLSKVLATLPALPLPNSFMSTN